MTFAADVATAMWYGVAGYAAGRAVDAAAKAAVGARPAPRFWLQLLLNAALLAALVRFVPAWAARLQDSVPALGFPALLFGVQTVLYPVA